jgi:hypothetical protein
LILTAYLSAWRSLRKPVQRALLGLLLGSLVGSYLWHALPAGKPLAPVSDGETPYSALSTRAVVRGGR